MEIGPDNREERVDNRSREGIREGKGKMVDRGGCKTAKSSLRPVHQFFMFYLRTELSLENRIEPF